MNKVTDEDVRIFIEEWEKDDPAGTGYIKQALTGLLIPFVYKQLREDLQGEPPIPLRSRCIKPLQKIKQRAIHFCWYAVWTIKWLIFTAAAKHPSRIVLTSFFRQSSLITQQLKIVDFKNDYFINFGVVYDLRLLLDPRFLCFPYRLYRERHSPETCSRYSATFKQVFADYFKIHFAYGSITEHYLNILLSVENSFRMIIDKVKKRDKCICLFQDCDYLAERVIFASISRMHSIPAITTDHSVIFYNHLFKNSHSDYALVWGEHRRQRLIKYSMQQPKRIIITGRPALPVEGNASIRTKEKWVYLLPAFQEAHLQSFNRSLINTLLRIEEIKKFIEQNEPGVSLLIKPHPSDNKKIFRNRFATTTKSIQKLIAECCLAFTEDSTASIDFLKNSIPLIYVADKENNNPLGLESIAVLKTNESAADKIREIKKYNLLNRENIFRYFTASGELSPVQLDIPE